jgi:hypothetical protein
MNNSINATTRKSPTEMVFGTTFCWFANPFDLAKPTQDVPAISDYIQRIQDNVAIARDRHAEAKTKQTTRDGRQDDTARGSLVLLVSQGLLTRHEQRDKPSLVIRLVRRAQFSYWITRTHSNSLVWLIQCSSQLSHV